MRKAILSGTFNCRDGIASKIAAIGSMRSKQASGNEPGEASDDKPTQAYSNEPTEASNDKPTQASSNEPTEVSVDKPAHASGNASIDKPTQASSNEPTEAPGNKHEPARLSHNEIMPDAPDNELAGVFETIQGRAHEIQTTVVRHRPAHPFSTRLTLIY